MTRITSGNNGITQAYKKGVHNGVDIGWHSKESDNVIIAHSDGVVEKVVKDCNKNYTTGTSFGNYIFIKHNAKYKTRYAHLKYGTVKVNVGDIVKKGQEIAVMGNTGHSLGRHLHFEVWENGTRIDPTPYIKNDLPMNKWEIGKEYECLKKKYVRTSPKVATNKIKYNNITVNKQKYCADKNGYGMTKIGEKFKFTAFTKDSKGNTWAKLKYDYVCVEDSTGLQFK